MERTHASKLPGKVQADSREGIKTLAHDIRMHKEDLKWLKFCTLVATAVEKTQLISEYTFTTVSPLEEVT